MTDAIRPKSLSRRLSPLEKLFWYGNLDRPNHFSIAAEVLGTRSPEQWQRALNAMAAASPVLCSSVVASGEGLPTFEPAGNPVVPLRVSSASTQSWTDEVADQLGCEFETGAAPLLRASLVEGEGATSVVLTAHHAVADGVSLVLFLRDVLATLAGNPPRRLPICDDVEALVAASSGELPHPTPGPMPPPLVQRGPRGGRPRCSAAVLAEDATAELRRRARSEATTVHAALAAGLTRAFREIRHESWEADVRVLSPIDLRAKLLGGAEHLGLCIGAALTPMDASTDDLWADARAVSAALAPSASIPTLLSVLGLLQSLEGAISSREAAAALFTTAFGCNVLLTNLGQLHLPEIYAADLTLRAIWGPAVVTGIEDQQSIGAATFGGRLHLLHASHSPAEDLLGVTMAILTQSLGMR